LGIISIGILAMGVVSIGVVPMGVIRIGAEGMGVINAYVVRMGILVAGVNVMGVWWVGMDGMGPKCLGNPFDAVHHHRHQSMAKNIYAYPRKQVALEKAKKLVCTGLHTTGSLWMPCESTRMGGKTGPPRCCREAKKSLKQTRRVNQK
jgi:hypothetical protein